MNILNLTPAQADKSNKIFVNDILQKSVQQDAMIFVAIAVNRNNQLMVFHDERIECIGHIAALKEAIKILENKGTTPGGIILPFSA